MNYYYLISSLPSISPKMEASQLDFDDIFDLIRRNLIKEDRKLLRYLIYPNDIHNLLSTLFQEYWGAPFTTFKKPSIFNREEIKGYKLIRRNFPDFINGFLAENEDRMAIMSMQEVQDSIMDQFYNKVYGLDNNFLTAYYDFIRSLKAIIAAFHFNTYPFLSQPNIIDADRLILQVAPDRAPSDMVMKDYPYLEDLIKVLSKNQPEKTERFLDRVLWDFLDEKHNGSFSREAVFAYTIKLQIIHRWRLIDAKKGSERFEKLRHHIVNNLQPSQTPIV